MTTPRTSFVIPARDAAATLAHTLGSVAAQSDPDWEALIVDDGSRDETPSVVAEWCARDSRFIALSAGGQGVSAARNVGLRQARGQRVVFLDSDDWHDPAFLEVMHTALDAAPGAVAAYCDYRRVWPDGTAATMATDEGMASAPFDTFARTCAVAIHAVLVPRETVARAGGFDTALRTCEDWDLWQRIARMGGRWVRVARPMAHYRLRPRSLSQDMARAQADGATVIRRAYGEDPRLTASDNAFPCGCAAGIPVETALAHHALWCHAYSVVRGASTAVPAALAALPSEPAQAADLAQTLIDGVALGLLVAPQQLAQRSAAHQPQIDALCASLGAMWADAEAAARVRSEYVRVVDEADGPHVAVVIPAYNGEDTLDETLRSVRAQTHRALEIIIVDDGSTDGTRALAERHAAVDRRVRVLSQRNLGVAAARNAGWRSSIAEYIAFVDADDLWAPTKIERQLGALRAAGPRAGLAYCWMATIDEAGHVLRQYGGTHHEGDVLDAMLLSNLVGCGSTPLLRRQALIDAGGFDSRLRAAQAEGCEDWLLYARVAGAWHYALVPEVLVGYRQRARSMSSDRLAMLRSHVLMCEQLVPLHPQRLRAMHRGLSGYCVHLISMTPRGQWASRVALWWALRRHPRAALRALALDLPLLALRRVRARLTPRRRREPAALPPSRQFLPRS